MARINSPASSLPDAFMSVYTDITKPLILEVQLTWFENIISDFLREHQTFPTQYGVIIRRSSWFTYVPVKMEDKEIIYLDGFSSNQDAGAYDNIRILCNSDEEKVAIRERICNALQELAEASVQAINQSKRSMRMVVGFEKIP